MLRNVIPEEKGDDTLVLRISGDQVTSAHAENCLDLSFGRKSYRSVLLDCTHVRAVEENAWMTLVKFGLQAESQKVRLVILANEYVSRSIKEKALEALLPCTVDIQTIGEDALIGKDPLESNEFLSLAFEGLRKTYEVYVRSEVTLGKTMLLASEKQPQIDIAGIGSFFCQDQKGSLVLGYTESDYLKVVSSITKKELDVIDNTVRGWAAEIINSIFGMMRTALKSRGLTLHCSIPSIVTGHELHILLFGKPSLTVFLNRCESKLGPVYLELSLSQQKK